MHTSLRETFDTDGVVRVPGILDGEAVAPMQAYLRELVASVDFVEVAGALRPRVGSELTMWAAGREPVFAALGEAFATAVRRVFGQGVWTQAADERGGFAMPNLPCPDATPGPCAVAWHVDEPVVPGASACQRLIVFMLLDRVDRGGGATVVLAGSHRRLEVLAGALGVSATTDVVVPEFARAEPWFAELLAANQSRSTDRCVSAGIPLCIRELTGDAGDVVLVDPRCLHTTSANVSTRPRLVMRMTGLRV